MNVALSLQERLVPSFNNDTTIENVDFEIYNASD
jgi:hypothetical protein